jgi:hypothetical protein
LTGEAWRHVPGAMNPADLPSCGCSVRQLRDEDVVIQERKGIVYSLSVKAIGPIVLRLFKRLRQGCTSPCFGPVIF